MNKIGRVVKGLTTRFRRVVLRDSFLLEASRWFHDTGDTTLRLDYPLTSESIVFDLGGYHGDFAEAINKKFHCKVYVFEPVPAFYEKCVSRFYGNPDVICLNYGLASLRGYLEICLSENASSFFSGSGHLSGDTQKVRVESIIDCIQELNLRQIDLLKINIEGGEFDVLTSLIESSKIHIVKYLQVQFHNFVPDAEKRRTNIREQLVKTHEEQWCYKFVWESWRRK